MDKWEKSRREDRYRRQRENPSFSSSLLDAICRSIDESKGEGEEELIFYRETMRKKHSNNGFKDDGQKEEKASLQRACMMENWMEKKVSCEKVALRRKSLEDRQKKARKEFDCVLVNSSSSSSESSSGGGFSSSESEPIYGRNSSTSSYILQRPKPIRTSVAARPERYQKPNLDHAMDMYHHLEGHYAGTQKPKHEGSSFVKTKSKALKIYGDLKKVKQPISPGGRLASFLNSIFTAGNAKKAKIASAGYHEDRKLKSEQESTCSSASSYSRSCLSKTPSSRGKLSDNGAKRSVRFCPVSVIVDEDCRPCGQKNLYGRHEESTLMAAVTSARINSTNEELKFHVMYQNRRVEEVARDLLKNYRKKKQDCDMRDACNGNEVCSEEEAVIVEEEDDKASCASSDLFELDNLSAIGIDRYSEELPVYETTHLDTNRAIANGLIM